jgi:16S rRNA C1402 (ribose-2'-O) methylase RsmI
MTLGTLYLCGVPIGNHQDATFRLIETLKKVDAIA